MISLYFAHGIIEVAAVLVALISISSKMQSLVERIIMSIILLVIWIRWNFFRQMLMCFQILSEIGYEKVR